MAKISVIIPVYKVEKYLRKCIDSIINQTFTDIEIVLVDDGSPDTCPAICDEYGKKDSRIKVIHKKNGGLSDARNTGMRIAEGEYFLFVDSDDWIEANTCELLFDGVKQYNSEYVLSAYYKETINNTKIKHLFNESKIVFGPDVIKERLFRRILGLSNEELRNPESINALNSICSKLFKREIIKNNGIEFMVNKKVFDADMWFNFVYTQYVNTAVYLDIPLYHYIRTNQSSGTTVYIKNSFNRWKEWKIHVDKFIEENSYHELLDEAFHNRYCFSVVQCGGFAVRSGSFKTAFNEINQFLKDQTLIESFKHFKLTYLPVHWKVFFFFAKYRMPLCFLLITKLMRYVMNKQRNLI